MTIAGEVLDTEPQAPAVEAPPPPPPEVKEKKIKPPKEKKPKGKTPKPHKSAAHPPYFQMIKDAIIALGEKSGSSPYAIAKYIEVEHKSVLPVNFRKILSLQLKNSAARGKLIKVKASYKLSQAGMRKRVAASRTPMTRAARANAGKPEETATKRRRSLRSKSVNQIEAAAKVKAAGGRRTRKPAPATKAKQPKSIRSAAKKAKKTVAV